MRIAISGTHATGKSTLIDELARRLDGFAAMPEPYYQLEAQGYVFGDPPTFDDLDMLFERTVDSLTTCRETRVLFDRSPADYLAYLAALAPDADLRDRVVAARDALAFIDLAVFVPIERPDRLASTESPRLRRRVDHILREMLVEQSWGFNLSVVEVRGTTEERADQVLAKLRELSQSAAWRCQPTDAMGANSPLPARTGPDER
jgi:predicted ATPase